jgi:hypothetical protein
VNGRSTRPITVLTWSGSGQPWALKTWDGYTEPPIVTTGTDFTGVWHLLSTMDGNATYTARDAVAYLLEHNPTEPDAVTSH